MSKAPGFASLEGDARRCGASGDLGYTAGTYALTIEQRRRLAMTEKGKYVTRGRRSTARGK
jgi:hypothetical protein